MAYIARFMDKAYPEMGNKVRHGLPMLDPEVKVNDRQVMFVTMYPNASDETSKAQFTAGNFGIFNAFYYDEGGYLVYSAVRSNDKALTFYGLDTSNTTDYQVAVAEWHGYAFPFVVRFTS